MNSHQKFCVAVVLATWALVCVSPAWVRVGPGGDRRPLGHRPVWHTFRPVRGTAVEVDWHRMALLTAILLVAGVFSGCLTAGAVSARRRWAPARPPTADDLLERLFDRYRRHKEKQR